MDSFIAPIVVDRNICRDFARASRLEWLETNHTGGYAMGTVAGVNTRRYHGLLVANLPGQQRCVTLAKLDEQVSIEGRSYSLATNQYPGVLSPQGFESLDSFRLDPFPVWTWQLDGKWLTKEVLLLEGKQAVVARYTCSTPCSLAVRPFLAVRDYHSLIHANAELNGTVAAQAGRFTIQPYVTGPALTFYHNASRLESDASWYYNLEYLRELERGMDFREDLYTPGLFLFDLEPDQTAFIVTSLEANESYDIPTIEDAFQARRQRQPGGDNRFQQRLTRASDQFRAARGDGRSTILAGFPWFTDWGRDTMVSLPGLLLSRGLLNEARTIIESFLTSLNQGLIPNRFPDAGSPEYNTCDATLWMVQAVWAYMQRGGDQAWIRSVFFPALKEIIHWHLAGTLHDIQANVEDGLLSAGLEGSQLTWMDAKVGDWVVTPRHGQPVEVNALWYNAIRMAAHWAAQFDDLGYAQTLSTLADRVRISFVRKFWNPERDCLYDVLGPAGPVAKVRPNQIFAVSLPFGLLTPDRERAVVDIVEQELLTPVGLRTLERGDPGYRGRYQGDPSARDGAYHQGTVWPWLLGPFVTAYLKVHGTSRASLQYCRALLERMEPELLAGGLGTLCEIYDGDPPYEPRGCVAQAWSVAEISRAWELVSTARSAT